MVRHSGFLTSLLAVLLAVFSVSLLHRRSDGSHDARRTQLPRYDRAVADLTWAPRIECDDHVEDYWGRTSPEAPSLRFQVPRNSLIIVGSLDTSGAAHSLIISSHPGEQCKTFANHSSPPPADLRYIPSAGKSKPLKTSEQPNACRVVATAKETHTTVRQSSSGQAAGHSLRRFLIPHFEHNHVVQQFSEASAIAEGSRVKVYVDRSLVDANSELPQNHPLRDTANRACQIIEDELLPLIELWIGRITDLDGDHRLSVVLTDLDRQKPSKETPVLGCVRRSDFLADDQDPLAGDIIYLDQHLPPQEQLVALLAHELTHAAVYCIRHEATDDSPLRNHSVPSWLNEAAAHWVERQFCSAPTGFAAREAAFRKDPAQCPIVLGDEYHYMASRRNGSRVAGFTFLQQHLTAPHAIRELLQRCAPFDQSMETTTQVSFPDLFREWTIRQACEIQDTLSPLRSRVNSCSLQSSDKDPIRRKLHGTAFLVLKSEVDQEVCIGAHRDAQLQITVMVHGSNRISTEHSPDFTAFNRTQSAKLEVGRLQTIR